MIFELTDDRDVRPDELLQLYESVGWINYTRMPQMLEAACRNSLLLITARKDGRLAGLIRVVGDGASVVLIQDLLVRPAYQRMGLGSHLVRSVMDRFPDVYQLLLMTDDRPAAISFYEKCGLRRATASGLTVFVRFSPVPGA